MTTDDTGQLTTGAPTAETANAAAPKGKLQAMGYDASEGERIVQGGRAVAVVALIVFLFNGQLWLLGVVAVALLVSLHYGPMHRPKRPQIILDDTGIVIEALGLIPWKHVREAKYTQLYVRSVQMAEITLELDGPIADCVTPTKEKPWRRLQTRIWRTPRANAVKIKFTGLKGKPEEMKTAIDTRMTAASLNA